MYYVILGTFVPSRRNRICDNMFYGFFDTEAKPPIPCGEMNDSDGPSMIGKIFLNDDHFEFSQVYEDNDQEIRYSFRREGDVWSGEFSGGKHGSGYAKCILNPVELRFLAC
jgi:hypothetical protein